MVDEEWASPVPFQGRGRIPPLLQAARVISSIPTPLEFCAREKGLAVWVGSVVLVKAAEDEPQSASEDAMVEEGGDGKNGGSGANGSGNNVHKKHEYAKLAADSLGDNGPSIVDLSITLQNAGAVCSYIVILGGLVTSLVMEVYKVRFPSPTVVNSPS